MENQSVGPICKWPFKGERNTPPFSKWLFAKKGRLTPPNGRLSANETHPKKYPKFNIDSRSMIFAPSW